MATAAMLAGCSGSSDDEPAQLTLSANVSSIDADGIDVATFSALLDGADVTHEATIECTSGAAELSGNTFATTEPGVYTFVASYGNAVSNQVAITANAVEASPYERQVCAMEITGAWCTQCPNGITKLRTAIEKDNALNGRVHIMAFHDNSSGADPMAIDETNVLCNKFGINTLPHMITDMRESVDLTSSVKDIKASFNRSIDEYPALCGVRIESAIAGTEANIAVTLKAAKAAPLWLALYIVEDRIIGTQKDGSLVNDEYLHRHVVRKLLSASVGGDKIGDFAAGQELTANYTAAISPDWNTANLEVYALAIDAKGYVTNMALCAADGGSVDYIYAQQ